MLKEPGCQWSSSNKHVLLRARLGELNNLQTLLISIFLSSSRVSAVDLALIGVMHEVGFGLHEVMCCCTQLCLLVQNMTSGASVLWG